MACFHYFGHRKLILLLLTVAEKLKKQGKAVADEQGDAEEVEDEHGNVSALLLPLTLL